MINLSETLRVSIANCETTRVGISSIHIYPMISSWIFRFFISPWYPNHYLLVGYSRSAEAPWSCCRPWWSSSLRRGIGRRCLSGPLENPWSKWRFLVRKIIELNGRTFHCYDWRIAMKVGNSQATYDSCEISWGPLRKVGIQNFRMDKWG